MANNYWISEVGGDVYVGAPTIDRQVYEGEEYVTPDDDDIFQDTYSTLAGTDGEWSAVSDTEISLVEKGEYLDALGALWDDAEDYVSPNYMAAIEGQYTDDELAGLFGSIGRAFKRAGRTVTRTARKAVKSVGSVGSDMVHTLNQVTRLPGKAVKATFGQIPYVGEAFNAAVDLSPAAALGGLTTRVLRGERIDRAFLKTAKQQIKAARTLAPYVQTVMSVVPGVGTGVAAAIAAGTALAEGRTITDAVLKGVKGALPGGPVAAGAFDTAVAITKGKRLDKAAINAVKAQLPPGAREAVDIVEGIARGDKVSAVAIRAAKRRLPPEARKAVDLAVKAGKGANAKDLLLQVVRSELPKEAQKAFEVGAAMGAARTIQSLAVTKAGSKPAVVKFARQGAKILSHRKAPKGLRKAARGLSRSRRAGFLAAVGAMSKSGVNAHALAAMRNRLGVAQRRGFDHAAKTILEANKARDPSWATLVVRGRPLRGRWKSATSRTSGAYYGRLVVGRKIQRGWFRRVA